MSKKSKPALGRGLNTLLGGATASLPIEGQKTGIAMLPLELIVANKEQPRQHFVQDSLDELAESIKHLGIIQPLTVRPEAGTSRYLIISGERRYRAAQLAGLSVVPVYIREAEGSELLELALVENIQREDLNPIEVALTYQRLLDQSGSTQEVLAERVGKKRATISNYMRLLQLPAVVQLGLSQHHLDMGHARALLQVHDPERQLELYQMILDQSLSVREVEELARAINSKDEPALGNNPLQRKVSSSRLPEEYHALEKHLGRVFSAKVSLRCSKLGKGKISIPFNNDEELERIMMLLERLHQQ